MKVLKSVSIAAIIAVLSVAPLSAKTLRNADEPAEFPPSSFKGSQYVDSRGCVYVRAGYGGGTQWVPRVTRSRDVMCGFKPTQIADAKLPVIEDPVAQAPAAQVQTPAPVVAEAPRAVARAPKPVAGQAVRVATPVAVAQSPARSTVVRVPSPTVTAAPAAQSPATQSPVGTAVPPATPVTVQMPTRAVTHVTRTADVGIRRGPQDVHPSDYVMKRLPAGVTVRTAGGGQITTTQPTMVRVPVAPVAVQPRYAAAPQSAAAPQYGSATVGGCAGLSGNAAQYMVNSGASDVRCGPQAQHPSSFVVRRQAHVAQTQAQSAQLQRAAAAQGITLPRPVPVSIPAGYTRVWEDGRLNPERGPRTYEGDLQQAQVWSQETPARDVYAPAPKTFWQTLFGSSQKKATVIVPQAPVAVAPSTRISTKSTAPATTPRVQAAPANLRYVQVGAFGVATNADKSIARLTSMGVPVSSQMLNRGGKSIKVVMAGPFGSTQQTMNALGSIRAAGYSDAFARK